MPTKYQTAPPQSTSQGNEIANTPAAKQTASGGNKATLRWKVTRGSKMFDITVHDPSIKDDFASWVGGASVYLTRHDGKKAYRLRYIKVVDEWRGTGLGQDIYDRAIQESKNRGALIFLSDDQRSSDDEAAWRRLRNRYPVEFDSTKNRHFIDLRSDSLSAVKQGKSFVGSYWYHGSNSETDFDTLKKNPQGIIWLADRGAATRYAHKHYLNGQSRLYEVRLKDGARIVDLRDLSNPVVRQFKEIVNGERKYGLGVIADEYWPGWADFGMLEGHQWAVRWFRSKRVDGILLKDAAGAHDHESLALLNPRAIESQRIVPCDTDKKVAAKPLTETLVPKAAESQFLYHVTYMNRLQSIGDSGLQPNQRASIGGAAYDGHRKDCVFLTDAAGVSFWLQRAEEFAYHNSDEPVVEGLVPLVLRVRSRSLRIEKDEVGSTDSGSEAVYIKRSIPPNRIEFWNGDRWCPATDAFVSEEEYKLGGDEDGYLRKDAPLFHPKLAASSAGSHITRPYYHGSVPGSAEKIRTGDDSWDAYFFVADDPRKAANYGSHVEEYHFKPTARILVEGTQDFNRLGRWRKSENLLEFSSRIARKAKEKGYDAVYFQRQGDVGTVVLNRDAIEKTGVYKPEDKQASESSKQAPKWLYDHFKRHGGPAHLVEEAWHSIESSRKEKAKRNLAIAKEKGFEVTTSGDLVLYHGTNNGDRIRRSGQLLPGSFLTTNKSEAEYYSTLRHPGQRPKAEVLRFEVYPGFGNLGHDGVFTSDEPIPAKDSTNVLKQAGKHKYGVVMAEIAANSVAHDVVMLIRDEIAEEDLAGEGKDIDPTHVTVRYGIQTDDTSTIEEYLSTLSPFEIKLGTTTSFPPTVHSDNAAVIIVPVQSAELAKINEQLANVGDFKAADFDYLPHVTVAYVKPEAAEKYVGDPAPEGETYTVTEIIVSDRNKSEKVIALNGAPALKTAKLPDIDTTYLRECLAGMWKHLAGLSNDTNVIHSMNRSLPPKIRVHLNEASASPKELKDFVQSGYCVMEDDHCVVHISGGISEWTRTWTKTQEPYGWAEFSNNFIEVAVHELTHRAQGDAFKQKGKPGGAPPDYRGDVDLQTNPGRIAYFLSDIEIAAFARMAVEELRHEKWTDKSILRGVRLHGLFPYMASASPAFGNYYNLWRSLRISGQFRHPDVKAREADIRDAFRKFLKAIVSVLHDKDVPISKKEKEDDEEFERVVMKASSEQPLDWQPILKELMTVLQPGLPVPKVQIVNKPNLRQSGQDTYRFGEDNTTIELQKSITYDERTLRRVLSHELCHHEDNLVNVAPKYAELDEKSFHKWVAKHDGHGPQWKAIAARFNAKYGEGFVNEFSDTDYVYTYEEVALFFVRMTKWGSGKLGWQHAKSITPGIRKLLVRNYQDRSEDPKLFGVTKLFQVTDAYFMASPTIGKFLDAQAKTPEDAEKAEKLFDEGNDLLRQYATGKTADGPTQDQDWMSKTDDITETPAFKAWFSGSKVVDDHGRPLRVYHGTNADFDKFHRNVWFAIDPKNAMAGGTDAAGRVLPVFLKMQKPYVLNEGELKDFRHATINTATANKMGRQLLRKALQSGHDGVLVPGYAYLVPDPRQIKSAIGNSEAFDPKNNSITAAVEPVDWHPILTELMSVLKPGLPTPEIKIVNRKANWLGQCSWKIGKKSTGESFCGDNTLIEIQKSVLTDEKTLRRILAHELAHHEDNLVNEKPEFERLGYDRYQFRYRLLGNSAAHGPKWRAIAERFNARYGADFVTEKSDQTYVLDSTDVKPYFVLMQRNYNGKLYFQHATRLSDKMKQFLGYKSDRREEYRLFTVTDPFYMQKSGTIGGRGWAYVKEEEQNERLSKLWNEGTDVFDQYAPASIKQAALPPTDEDERWARVHISRVRETLRSHTGDPNDYQLLSILNEEFNPTLHFRLREDRVLKPDTPIRMAVPSAGYRDTRRYDIPSITVDVSVGAGAVLTAAAHSDDGVEWKEFANRFVGLIVHEITHDKQFSRAKEHLNRQDSTGQAYVDYLRGFSKKYHNPVKEKWDGGVKYLTQPIEVTAHARQAIAELRAAGWSDEKIFDNLKTWQGNMTASHASGTFYRMWDISHEGPKAREAYRKFLEQMTKTLDQEKHRPISQKTHRTMEEIDPSTFSSDRPKGGGKLTHVGSKAVQDMPGFRTWFSGSKVVNPDGSPMKLYHGTTNSRNILDTGFKKGWVHLTDSKPVADSYQQWDRGDSPATLEVYARATNPAYYDAKGQKYTDIGNRIYRATSDAERSGHDAIIITDIRDNFDSSVPTAPHTTVVVFSPNQIKSATGNNGNFDPNSNSIVAAEQVNR